MQGTQMQTLDAIVVGAGSAACAVANCLSAKPARRVHFTWPALSHTICERQL